MTNKPKDEIDEILKDYRTNLFQQMGFILSGKHRLDIKTANKMLIETPTQAISQHYAKLMLDIVGDDEIGNIGYVGEDFVDDTSEEMLIRNQFREELREQAKLKLMGKPVEFDGFKQSIKDKLGGEDE